jgi:hypothetical protein
MKSTGGETAEMSPSNERSQDRCCVKSLSLDNHSAEESVIAELLAYSSLQSEVLVDAVDFSPHPCNSQPCGRV